MAIMRNLSCPWLGSSKFIRVSKAVVVLGTFHSPLVEDSGNWPSTTSKKGCIGQLPVTNQWKTSCVVQVLGVDNKRFTNNDQFPLTNITDYDYTDQLNVTDSKRLY